MGGTARSGRRLAAVTAGVVLVLLAFLAGTALAQSDQTEIEITVHPASGTPAPSPGVQPAPTGGLPPVSGSDAPPVAIARPGTLSARIVLVQDNPLSEAQPGSVTFVVVRDDRGTAEGWDVTLLSSAPGGHAWVPELFENRYDSIRRVVPEWSALSDKDAGVRGGRVLGPFATWIPLLHADVYSGSGVHLQQLGTVFPLMPDGVTALVIVQLPFGP